MDSQMHISMYTYQQSMMSLNMETMQTNSYSRARQTDMSQKSRRSTHCLLNLQPLCLPSLQPLCLKPALHGDERLKVCPLTAMEQNGEQDLGLCTPDSSVLPLSRQCLVCPRNLTPHRGDNDLNTIWGPSTPAVQAGGNKLGEEFVVLLYLHNYVTGDQVHISNIREQSNSQSRVPCS